MSRPIPRLSAFLASTLLASAATVAGLTSALVPATVAFAQEYEEVKPSDLPFDHHKVVIVDWNTEEGQRRLQRTPYKNDFLQTAHLAETQERPTNCGIATIVTILNASRLPKHKVPTFVVHNVDKPKVYGGGKVTIKFYTQDNFFDERTEKVKPQKMIEVRNATPENTNDKTQFEGGLTLEQLKGMFEAKDFRAVMTVHASEDEATGLPKFRDVLKQTVSEGKRFIAANFVGKTFGAPTGGHIVPLVAYDEQTDSVLLLDVAGYLQPWNWVPVRDMYAAMHTVDDTLVGKQYRGYIVVEDTL